MVLSAHAMSRVLASCMVYALAMLCPVPAERVVLPAYAMPGTDEAYGATRQSTWSTPTTTTTSAPSVRKGPSATLLRS
eukprot:3530882-Rhodomonas_salina.1